MLYLLALIPLCWIALGVAFINGVKKVPKP